jgi:hypothetical protein
MKEIIGVIKLNFLAGKTEFVNPAFVLKEEAMQEMIPTAACR